MSDWLFVEATKELPAEPLRTLGALRVPFSPPVWVGEARAARLSSPETREQVERAIANGALLAFVPASGSVVGTLGTVVRPIRADDDSMVVLVGVGRCVVVGIASSRPTLELRVRPLVDLAVSADEITPLSEQVRGLWADCTSLHERLVQLRLKAKLRKLGSKGSAALLAIPLEQQLALSTTDAQCDAPGAAAGGGGGGGNMMEEALARKASLAEEVKKALTLLPEADGLAAAPATTGAVAEGTLLSFVALRLTDYVIACADGWLLTHGILTHGILTHGILTHGILTHVGMVVCRPAEIRSRVVASLRA